MPRGGVIETTFSSNRIAQIMLENDFSLDALRNFAVLDHEDWIDLDDVVLESYHDRLLAVQNLIDRGLTHDAGDFGETISQYSKISEMTTARRSMYASADQELTRVTYSQVQVPIPVTFQDFSLDVRTLRAGRRRGQALDTVQAEEAARVVGESIESMLFDGDLTVMADIPIYGLRNHPNRNIVSGSTWGTASNIIPNVQSAVALLRADNRPGSYMMYLHADQYGEVTAVNTATDRTYRQILLEAIPDLEDIVWASKCTAGEAVLHSMDRGTVDMAITEQFLPIEWEGMGGLRFNMRAMAMMSPRVKADAQNRSGVCIITGI